MSEVAISNEEPQVANPEGDVVNFRDPLASVSADNIAAELSRATPINYSTVTERLATETFVMAVELGLPGQSKQADTDQVYHGTADKELLRVSKKILKSPEVDAVRKHDQKFKTTLKKRNLAMPSRLRGGFFRISKPNLNQIHKLRGEFLQERAQLVERAVATYEQRRIETMSALDHLANEGDYMSVAEFRDKFYASIEYIPDDAPTFLDGLSPEISEEMKREYQETMKSNVDEIILALRAQFTDYVTNLADRLACTEDGRKPNLHGSTLNKVKNFIDDFQNLNIANDAELEILVNKAKSILDGTSTDTKEIVKNQDLREVMAGAFKTIADVTKSEEFATLPGRRKFGFTE